MAKLYYLRGAIGDRNLLDKHQGAIERILTSDHSEKNLEKLRGHNVYSFRLNKVERLLFTLRKVNGHNYLLILEHLPTHDYQNSRFLKSGVLRNYLEAHIKADLKLVQHTFDKISDEEIKPIVEALRSDEGEKELIEVDYYRQQWIELSADQQEGINVKLPAIINGVAGSGKSCMALSLLSSYVTSHLSDDGPPLPLLYITKSNDLVQAMRRDWEALPVSKDGLAVHFKTYNDWLAELIDDKEATWVGQEAFTGWYKRFIKREARNPFKSKQGDIEFPDGETAYRELRICCAYTEGEYKKLGQRQSFLPEDSRGWLYKAYEAYSVYLKDNNTIDPGLYTLKPAATYDLVVVDEAQDLSLLQLGILNALAQNNSIAYCLDNHQKLDGGRSIRPYLQQLLGKNASHINLNKMHRCPLQVVRVMNAVLEFKHRLAGGVADKKEATRIESSEIKLGHVFVVNERELRDNEWTKKQAGGTNFAVVTSESNRDEAKKLFKTPLVFTPQEIKGLEYDVVVAYRLYADGVFKKASKRLRAVKDSKQPTNQAKAGAGDDRFVGPLNEIYTSYSRAEQVLVICEKENRYNRALLQPLRKTADKGLPNDECLQSEANSSDWETQVYIQLHVGNIGLAWDIVQQKLGGSEDDFNQLLDQFNEVVEEEPKPSEAQESQAALSPPSPASQPDSGQGKPSGASVEKPETRSQKADKPRSKGKGPASTTPVHVARTESRPKPLEESIEATQARNLYTGFTEKRLYVVLKLVVGGKFDLMKVLYDPFQHEGNTFNLRDCICSDVNKGREFIKSIVNSLDLFIKLPIDDFKNFLSPFERIKEKLQPLIEFKEECKWNYSFKVVLKIVNGLTPAHIAAQRGRVEALRVLDELGADLNATMSDGRTTATLAAEKGHVEVLQVLGELGADLNATMDDGATPAFIAAKNGSVEALQVLHDLDADLDKALNDGTTPAYIAACEGHIEALEVLGKMGADLNAGVEDGATPACIAAYKGYSEALQVLGAFGVDLNVAMNDGATPVHIAVEMGHVKAIRVLYELGVDLNTPMSDGLTPAHVAAEMGHVEVLLALGELGADLNAASKDGATPAYIAAENDQIEALEMLGKLGAKLNQAKKNGATPAHVAAQMVHVDALQVLGELGANLELAFNDGVTLAYIAAENEQVEVLRALHKRGANLDAAMIDGSTPAHIAAYQCNIETLQVLGELGADLNAFMFEGSTPAHLAAHQGYIGILQVLAQLGADLNLPTNDGATPAYIAAEMGLDEVLRVLYKLGANLDLPMKDGSTPAHIAAKKGHVEVLQVLCDLGANLDVARKDGATPAYIAAEIGHADVLWVLKRLGANLDAPMQDGSTPAHIAAQKGHVEVLQILNELGAKLNAARNDGATPASIAKAMIHVDASFFSSNENQQVNTSSKPNNNFRH
jgi:ankyrin repeat protein